MKPDAKTIAAYAEKDPTYTQNALLCFDDFIKDRELPPNTPQTMINMFFAVFVAGMAYMRDPESPMNKKSLQ
jgi:hypothetical protein